MRACVSISARVSGCEHWIVNNCSCGNLAAGDSQTVTHSDPYHHCKGLTGNSCSGAVGQPQGGCTALSVTHTHTFALADASWSSSEAAPRLGWLAVIPAGQTPQLQRILHAHTAEGSPPGQGSQAVPR